MVAQEVQQKVPMGLIASAMGALLLALSGYILHDIHGRIGMIEQELNKRAWMIQRNDERSKANEARLGRIEAKLDRIMVAVGATKE